MYNAYLTFMLLIGSCYAIGAAIWLLDRALSFHERGMERVRRYNSRA